MLLLDEPTNHLDLDGKEELAAALKVYEGGCILVSHDRELLAHACNRFWVVHDGRLEEWQDAADAFASLGPVAVAPGASLPAASVGPRARTELDDLDAILMKLCELERLLSEDLARKPRDQKPARQLVWQAEIAVLSDRLKHD